MDSCFDFFGWTGVGRVLSQPLVGGASFLFLVVVGRYLWVFPLPGHELSSDPRECARLRLWRRYL